MYRNIRKIFSRSLTILFLIMVSVAFLAEESKAITAVPDDMVLINAGGFTRGVDNTKGENFSDEAKKQLASLQFSVSEGNRLQALLAVTKTAQSAYTKALKDALESA